MRCRNCGQVDRFVLLVELAVVARSEPGSSGSRRAPPDADGATSDQEWNFADPDWGLSLACDACASTDVVGDPASLLLAYGG